MKNTSAVSKTPMAINNTQSGTICQEQTKTYNDIWHSDYTMETSVCTKAMMTRLIIMLLMGKIEKCDVLCPEFSKCMHSGLINTQISSLSCGKTTIGITGGCTFWVFFCV